MKLLFCFFYELYLHSNCLFKINVFEFFFMVINTNWGKKEAKLEKNEKNLEIDL